MKEYILKPIMTPATLNLTPGLDKPAVLPPRQPLPAPVIDPTKPMLKLGLDVHLEFSMVVVQPDHAQPKAPRKFSRQQLVAQVQQWVSEGRQVFCVQESCGFGFTLHRELVAAGAQSFLITPIALNGPRKTTSWTRARCACGCRAGWRVIGTNSRPFAFPVRPSNANAKARGDESFCNDSFGCWPIAGRGRWRSINT